MIEQTGQSVPDCHLSEFLVKGIELLILACQRIEQVLLSTNTRQVGNSPFCSIRNNIQVLERLDDVIERTFLECFNGIFNRCMARHNEKLGVLVDFLDGG